MHRRKGLSIYGGGYSWMCLSPAPISGWPDVGYVLQRLQPPLDLAVEITSFHTMNPLRLYQRNHSILPRYHLGRSSQ